MVASRSVSRRCLIGKDGLVLTWRMCWVVSRDYVGVDTLWCVERFEGVGRSGGSVAAFRVAGDWVGQGGHKKCKPL